MHRRSRPARRSGGSLALAVTVTTWAAAFPAIRVGLEGFSPWALGLLRLGVASAALATVAGVARLVAPDGAGVLRVPPRRHWGRIVLAGLVGQTLYQGLLMTGELTVPAGTAAILIAVAPLFSVAVAWVVLGERSSGVWPGMLVAFSGAALVGLSLGGLGGGAASLWVLAAAACQGAYHVVVKPLSQEIGALAATTWSVWAGAVLALPALPALLREAPSAGASAWTAAVLLGLLPSALGHLAWSTAVARTTIARSTAALYLVPVVALLLAWWWLGERPSFVAVVGGLVAVAGVAMVRLGQRVSAPSTGRRSALR